MVNMTVKDIIDATSGSLLQGDVETAIEDICFNSKDIKEGDLFVPIIGANVDAHKFIPSAMLKGVATLTSHKDIPMVENKAYILVEDTVAALQSIGSYIRSRYNIPVVGITGSVGKTTTREMITSALQTRYNTFHTEGNFNSQIGVPIILSRMSPENQVAVLEMGMSEPGQIDILTKMVRPSICVVTTIGLAHIEYMKTQENIRKEKLSIINGMPEGGILLLNGDDAMLAEMRGKMPCTTLFYGRAEWCDYKADNIEFKDGKSYFRLSYKNERVSVTLNVMGKHNVDDCLAALAVAHITGIPFEEAKKGFTSFDGLRQQIITLDKFTIIDDTYNASPASVKAAVDVLCDIPVEGRRFLVLADMLELGEHSPEYHYDIGTYILDKNIDELIVVGELAMNIKKAVEAAKSNVKVYSFTDNEEVAIYLLAIMQPGDVVLLKGSNGMRLKEVVDILKA